MKFIGSAKHLTRLKSLEFNTIVGKISYLSLFPQNINNLKINQEVKELVNMNITNLHCTVLSKYLPSPSFLEKLYCRELILPLSKIPINLKSLNVDVLKTNSQIEIAQFFSLLHNMEHLKIILCFHNISEFIPQTLLN